MTTTAKAASSRAAQQARFNPVMNGLQDPRPLTDYAAVLSTVAGKSRLTITLTQPCIIRQPLWPVIDCVGGSLVYPSTSTVVSNTVFYMDWAALITPSSAFVQVPYQDMQVQNFQGGFVRPGGQWFREPQMPA